MIRFDRLATAAAGAIVLASTAGQAQATTFVDDYIGGTNPGAYVDQDVVASPGDNRFDITSMDVTRVGDSLKVVVNTNYSGPNVGALGTNLGDLFLGVLGNLSPTAFSNTSDTYTADPDRFSYVFDFDTTPLTGPTSGNDAPTPQGGSATLYSLLGDGSDVVLTQDVNVGGFRQNQAIDIEDTAKATAGTGVAGTWSTSVGNVTFNIANFFSAGGLGASGGIFSTGLTLAWAMTCANDIIVVQVPLSGSDTPEVPLPAGLILLLSGLLGLGFMGRAKARPGQA